MRKRAISILFLVLVFAGAITPIFVAPQTAQAKLPPGSSFGLPGAAVAYLAEQAGKGCIIPSLFLTPCPVEKILVGLMNMWFWLIGRLLWLTSQLFELTLQVSVIHLGFLLGKGSTFVQSGWTAIRDICNFFFIFVLLWIAIKTILGVGGDTKRRIVIVILAALLINFSAAFTRLVIDPGNILALTFYNAAKTDEGPPVQVKTISEIVIKRLDLIKNAGLVEAPSIPAETDPTHPELPPGDPEKLTYSKGLTVFQIVTQAFGGSLFILAATILFLVFSIMLLYRTLILVFLVMVSPWPFFSSAFSGSLFGSSSAQSWWKELICQTYWLPISMMLFWISLTVIGSGGEALDKMSKATPYFGGTFFMQIVFFFMSIGLLYTSLIVGKKMGCAGAAGVTAWGEGKIKGMATGSAAWLGKNTIGRGAAAVAENKYVKGAASRVPGGRALYGGLDKMADAKFGGKAGYVKTIEEDAKAKAKFGDRLAKDKRTGDSTPEGEAIKAAYRAQLAAGSHPIARTAAVEGGAVLGGAAGGIPGAIAGAVAGKRLDVGSYSDKIAAGKMEKGIQDKIDDIVSEIGELEDEKKGKEGDDLKRVQDKIDEKQETRRQLVKKRDKEGSSVTARGTNAAGGTASGGPGAPRASLVERGVLAGVSAVNKASEINQNALGNLKKSVLSQWTSTGDKIKETVKTIDNEFAHAGAAGADLGAYTKSFEEEEALTKEVAKLQEDIKTKQGKASRLGFRRGVVDPAVGEMEEKLKEKTKRLGEIQSNPWRRITNAQGKGRGVGKRGEVGPEEEAGPESVEDNTPKPTST